MTALSLRLLLPILGAALLFGPALADPAPSPPASTPKPAPAVHMPARMTAADYRMGNPKAKVTVVEYGSDTCSHCAKFAVEVFPDFKKKYIDTGKALYIFREFPTDPEELSAAGFVLARCAGPDKYFDVVNTLWRSQGAATGREFLMAGAKAGGLDEDQVKACLDDPAAIADLNKRVQEAVSVEKIDGTPTFIVNGKKLNDGEKTMVQMDAAIEPLLKPTKGKASPPPRKG